MRKRFLFLTAVMPFLAAVVIQNTIAAILILAFSQKASYLCFVAAVILCGILFFFWYRNEISGEPRGNIKNIIAARTIGCFVVLGIGCQFFFTGVISMLSPYLVEIFTDYAKVIDNITTGNSILVILLTVFLAPIGEELIFRGMVLHRANRYIPFLGANMMQAVLFGIYHGNVVQGVYAALLGFLLGVIYQKYRSIIAPILLHMLINASAYLAYLLPEKTLSAVVAVVGGICVLAALYLIKPRQRVPFRTSVRMESAD